MPLSKQPFFTVPFPDPPIQYNDLTQAQRDAWVDYCRSVKIGWLDYQTIIRQSDEGYYMAVVSDQIANGGTTSMLYPPDIDAPPAKAIAIKNGAISIAPIVALPAGKTLDTETTLLVWATAPADTPEELDPKVNAYIGTITFPAGSNFNHFSNEIAAGYVAEFGSLEFQLDKWILLFSFTYTNGKLTYNGGWQVQVKTLCQYGCDYYWPLNEAGGQRQSLAEPAQANPSGTLTQVSGPIDYALGCQSVSGPIGVTAPNIPWPEYNNAFSIACWVRRDGSGAPLAHMNG